VVIVGAQWGDEGKGKVVDLFTEFADLVVRYGGGNNAGHTLVVDGQKIVTHLVPSGVLRPGVICVLGDGMVIDPKVLVDEISALKQRGLLAQDKDLVIGAGAHLVMPYHREIDGLREQGPGKIGTTKRGIGPAYECKVARRGLRIADLLKPVRLKGMVERNLLELNPYIERLGGKPMDPAAVVAEYAAHGRSLERYVGDASRLLGREAASGRNILFEGAQGALLDIDHGTYPFVTSSNTVAGGACTGCGVGPTFIDTVIGISKVYTTRVGSGPFPTELLDATGERLRQVGAEFGTTTGRPRRTGWLDAAAVRFAVRVNGISGLALTKLDVLRGIKPLSICVGYRAGGRHLDEIPLDPDDIATAEPIYEQLDGWDDETRDIREFEDLPSGARSYIRRIEALVGVPVILVSVGPGRAETIVLHNPFRPRPSDATHPQRGG
jgi:adenylosuccinate synthase